MSNTASVDSKYAWARLFACLTLTTIGSAGMYVVVVALPAFQVDFAISRAGASLPFTMVMLGFGIGGIVTGKLIDRYGVALPIAGCALALGLSLLCAAHAPNYPLFLLAHVALGWFGPASTFGPLLADISKWFFKRRGLAVAIAASGNYLAGALWPKPLYKMLEANGWRDTYTTMAMISVTVMLPLIFMLRARPHSTAAAVSHGGSAGSPAELGLTPTSLTALLCVAGVGCCVAMAMPQVHLVSLCADRGFGAARGAEMLSVMLGCGIVSRLIFGQLSDRLGGLRTLLISGILQGVALLMFLPAQGMVALYVASAMFGLFQGGIVPSYALIVREYFPEAQAGGRIGLIIFATIVGMAFGGWGSGAIYDLSHSYTLAFVHGIGWNLVNVWVTVFLLSRARGRGHSAHNDGAMAAV
ncbi:MAG: MFS transporter [Gammaproteobacteria bacterium]|nr:MFS transporter [Gammaproteobacteria bacterium]